MTTLLPPVLTSRELPVAELSALRLDGEAFPLDTGLLSPDEPETPHHRGAALAEWVPGKLVVERTSALWVAGFLRQAPAVRTLAARRGDRAYLVPRLGVVVRETSVAESDCERLGGVLVTAAARTLYDLAFQAEELSPAVAAAMAALSADRPDALAAAVARIEAGAHLPGKRRALRRLA